MEIPKIGSGFCGLKIGNLPSFVQVHLPPYYQLEKLAKNADVFITFCEKEFPYAEGKISKMNISALKISARPLNLPFWKRIFNKQTITEYFPVGNMKNSVVYDKSRSVLDVITDIVSKVQ